MISLSVDPGIAFGLALACDDGQALVSSADYDCSGNNKLRQEVDKNMFVVLHA